MYGGLGLSDLPQDVLLHVGLFLRYNDLVALSASCSYLRNILNVDCVWKRVVGGDVDVLGTLPGVIEDPSQASGSGPPPPLPPLCHKRVLCLRRTQLVNNVRKQNFSKQTTRFTGFLYTLETTQMLIMKSCTFKGKYLFGIDYESEDSENEVVKVIHLGGSTISTVTDFRPYTKIESYSVTVTCQVVGDKLVVRQDKLFDVYRINITPLFFTFLHLINAQHGLSEYKVILVGNIIFSENDFIKVVRVWDVHTGQQFDDLASKVKGFDLTIIGHSTEFKAVLFLSEGSESPQSAYIFEYSTKSMVFTEFSIKLEVTLITPQMIGLVNDKKNIILIPLDNFHMLVRVYDRTRSVLVCDKEFEDIHYSGVEGEFFTIKDCLALGSLTSIKIILLNNLEMLWEIFFDNAPRLSVYELPVLMHAEYRYLNIANALHLIVISTNNECLSFWDFELRRKLFELPAGCTDVCINNTCTKLIFRAPEKEELCVWSFGDFCPD